jgi:hypothetical protein
MTSEELHRIFRERVEREARERVLAVRFVRGTSKSAERGGSVAMHPLTARRRVY